ncbi:MAG: PfkB family carbohydrate kinase [Candidatus Nezhaarchaeota archaeon]|nr:PfkB family carbohydrate kinase [Candidatus Nezhaarchaeota archaeon]MCX8142219.1 PfkB family carbohydrate kinase [Candidatus Nezhaarchaeota archaeon]MDW8050808.1 PfkB family carbohydrate kinase [Nitrososphaerota archaeon]
MVTIGNPVYDIIITPFVRSFGRILSGCSVNSALIIKMLGMREVAVVGCIGSDYKERFVRELLSKGVQPIIVKTTRETTGFKLNYLDFSGNRELEVLGLSGTITVSDLPYEVLNAKMIVVGPVIGEIDPDIPAFFRRRGMMVFLDPQGFLREVRGGVVEHFSNPAALEVCSESHVVKPNELEARLLSGFNEPLKAAIAIYEKTGAITALTLAEKGSIVVNGERAIIVPAYPTYLIDPTGAGDVYLGSLAYYLHKGLSLEDAASYASAIASIKVENLAGHFSLNMSEVSKRAAWIKRRVRIKRLR